MIDANSTVAKVIAQWIRSLLQGIRDLDRKVGEATAAHPEFFIFRVAARSGASACTSIVGSVLLETSALSERAGGAVVQ